jgi:hypothetical protein
MVIDRFFDEQYKEHGLTDAYRPLLVGESNPYGGDPYYALYPAPEGCAGHRLCTKVMGLSITEYLRRFDRVNLCDGKWGMKEARLRASNLLMSLHYDLLILFGAKVSSAFDFRFTPFESFERLHYRFVILPHPSGLSRAWHEPGAFERARAVLKEAGVL